MSSSKDAAAESFLTRGHFSHLSAWQPLLADSTFETVFVTLSDLEARALLKLTEYSRLYHPERVTTPDGGQLPDPFELLSDEHTQSVGALEQRLDDALRNQLGTSHRVPLNHCAEPAMYCLNQRCTACTSGALTVKHWQCCTN